MKLVVGLGNPGRKYETTRHNIGYEVVQELAKRHGQPALRAKYDGHLGECTIASERTLLLMPQTFMNLSGHCVQQVVNFHKLPLEDLILICDDFHLPLGTLRLRPAGSDGGQKGLADTIRHLGTDQFARLRFGVGPVPERWQAADFVLGKFTSDEQIEVEKQVSQSCDAVETWIHSGIGQAMNQYNGNQLSEEP